MRPLIHGLREGMRQAVRLCKHYICMRSLIHGLCAGVSARGGHTCTQPMKNPASRRRRREVHTPHIVPRSKNLELLFLFSLDKPNGPW